jgi:hypothetical protein
MCYKDFNPELGTEIPLYAKFPNWHCLAGVFIDLAGILAVF